MCGDAARDIRWCDCGEMCMGDVVCVRARGLCVCVAVAVGVRAVSVAGGGVCVCLCVGGGITSV